MNRLFLLVHMFLGAWKFCVYLLYLYGNLRTHLSIWACKQAAAIFLTLSMRVSGSLRTEYLSTCTCCSVVVNAWSSGGLVAERTGLTSGLLLYCCVYFKCYKST